MPIHTDFFFSGLKIETSKLRLILAIAIEIQCRNGHLHNYLLTYYIQIFTYRSLLIFSGEIFVRLFLLIYRADFLK